MEDRINYKLQPQQTTDNSISLTNEANSNDDDNDEIDEIREHELQEQYKKLTESRVKFQALKDETEANIDPVKVFFFRKIEKFFFTSHRRTQQHQTLNIISSIYQLYPVILIVYFIQQNLKCKIKSLHSLPVVDLL